MRTSARLGIVLAASLAGRALACDTPWQPLISGAVGGFANVCMPWNDGSGDKLVIGGEFFSIGGVSLNGIGVWNGTSIAPLAQGLGGGGGRAVKALAVLNGQLIAAGNFTPGAAFLNKVARWSPSAPGVGTWVQMGDLMTTVDVRAMAVYRGELYIGGEFLSSNTAPGGPIALLKWDNATQSWVRPPGQIPPRAIYAMTVYNDELVVGGDFTFIDPSVQGASIARWNGTSWQRVGGTGAGAGIPGGWVNALHVHDGHLYVGGQIAIPGSGGPPTESGLLRYDPGSVYGFVPVGANYSMDVQAMASYQGRLIVGGTVSRVAGTQGASVAAWDGSRWDRIGGQIFSGMRGFGVYQGDLIAAGNFGNGPWASPSAMYLGRLACSFCVADFDDGAGAGQRDNAVGVEDLVYFLQRFEEGSLEADIDDGNRTGTRDEGVGIADLLYFIEHFEGGC